MTLPLPMIVDVPDLEAALVADEGGVFHDKVAAYLKQWEDELQKIQNSGVPREEFDRLSRLSASITTAQKVIHFFSKVKPANTAG